MQKFSGFFTDLFHIVGKDGSNIATAVIADETIQVSWESIRGPFLQMALLYAPIAVCHNTERNQIAIAIRDNVIDRSDLLRKLNEFDSEGEGWSVGADGIISCPFTTLVPEDLETIDKTLTYLNA